MLTPLIQTNEAFLELCQTYRCAGFSEEQTFERFQDALPRSPGYINDLRKEKVLRTRKRSEYKKDRDWNPTIKSDLAALKEAYREQRDNMTETSKRVEFLEECLETGVSKREAARMLVMHNPRVGGGTAETLVYLNFSDRYQTTLRGRRKGKIEGEMPVAPVALPLDVKDDESIL